MKSTFEEKFAILVFCCLFLYICVCTFLGIKTDSIRDSWSIILIIVGTVWKTTRKSSAPAEQPTGVTTATINAQVTTSDPAKDTTVPEIPADRLSTTN